MLSGICLDVCFVYSMRLHYGYELRTVLQLPLPLTRESGGPRAAVDPAFHAVAVNPANSSHNI